MSLNKKLLLSLLVGVLFLAPQAVKKDTGKKLEDIEREGRNPENPKLTWVEGQRGWAEDGTYLWTGVAPLPTYNVGIGTATPAYKLHVVGNSKIEGDLYINSWPIRVTAAPSAGYVLKWDAVAGAFVPQPDQTGTTEWNDAGEYLYPADDGSQLTRVYESATPTSGYRLQAAYNSSIYGRLGTQNSGVYGTSNNTSGAGVMGIGTGTAGVYGSSDASNDFGVVGFNTNASGTGIFGVGNNASGTYLTGGSGVAGSGNDVGVFGKGINNSGVGILGVDNATSIYLPGEGAGVAGTGDTIGVIGYNATTSAATYGYLGGITGGVVGVNTAATLYNSGVTGFSNANNTIGVFGQATGTPSVGVVGTDGPFYWSSDGPVGISGGSNNAFAGIFYSVNGQPIQAFIGNTTYWGFNGEHTSLSDEFWARFDGQVYADGFNSPTFLSNGELVLLSPLLAVDENRVVLFGRGKIVNGKGEVILDQKQKEFLSQTEDYYVFLTPLGRTNGLCIVSKNKGKFVVEEVANGKNTLEFDYMIVGIQKGKENIQKYKEGYLTRMRNTEKLLAGLKLNHVDKGRFARVKTKEVTAQVARIKKQIKELQMELKRIEKRIK